MVVVIVLEGFPTPFGPAKATLLLKPQYLWCNSLEKDTWIGITDFALSQRPYFLLLFPLLLVLRCTVCLKQICTIFIESPISTRMIFKSLERKTEGKKEQTTEFHWSALVIFLSHEDFLSSRTKVVCARKWCICAFFCFLFFFFCLRVSVSFDTVVVVLY